MLNKLYIYLLFNILKVNVPLPAFVDNHAPFPPSDLCPLPYGGVRVPPPHKEICMDNPAVSIFINSLKCKGLASSEYL